MILCLSPHRHLILPYPLPSLPTLPTLIPLRCSCILHKLTVQEHR